MARIVSRASGQVTAFYQNATFDGSSCKWEGKETCVENNVKTEGSYVLQITGDHSQISGTVTVTNTQNSEGCKGTYQLNAQKA